MILAVAHQNVTNAGWFVPWIIGVVMGMAAMAYLVHSTKL